ncbi:MAG TPA: enoyl-CoA hydratase-related protein [Pyrinomonadaceae bacterium]|nr:enoyl-CoA hydratase-related protein [Pyrinomonadaceae bacterium]
MIDTKLIVYERDGGRASIFLNRPEKRNALSAAMISELSELLRLLAGDSELRVIIFSAKGDGFCAGTDITELGLAKADQAMAISKRGQHLCDQIESFPIPVIAAINGAAVGGGCELALAAHMRLASVEASFSLPEVRLGVIPGYGGTQRLTREVGIGRAVELMLTGKTLNAVEAFELGLVNRVVTEGNLLDAANQLANVIESLAPLSIRAGLKAVIEGSDMSLANGLELETALFASLFETEDFREGTAAFLEKRKPEFKGR